MTPEQAVAAVHDGNLVECSAKEWAGVRDALQKAAGKWIDQGQDVRAEIAINEVRRLDWVFGTALGCRR